MNSPVGPPCFVPLARDYGVLGFQSPSPVPDTLCLSSIRCSFPQYSVVVLDTPYLSSIRCACPKYARPVLYTPYLSSIRCACPRYAVPVQNTLSCPFAVPVLNTLCLFPIRCACRKYVELAFRCTCSYLARKQQTHFRSSLLSLLKIATTGNASAVRRLVPIRSWILTLIPLYICAVHISELTFVGKKRSTSVMLSGVSIFRE